MEENEKQPVIAVADVRSTEIFSEGQIRNYEVLFQQCDEDDVSYLTLAEVEKPFRLAYAHRSLDFDKARLKKLSSEMENHLKRNGDEKYYPALFTCEQFIQMLAVDAAREGLSKKLSENEITNAKISFTKHSTDDKADLKTILQCMLSNGQWDITETVLQGNLNSLFGEGTSSISQEQYIQLLGTSSTQPIVIISEGDYGPSWCSWCRFVKTIHSPVVKTMPVGRQSYFCKRCLLRTLRCLKCESAMTKGGSWWDDLWCSVCNQEIKSWEDPRQYRGCHCM